MRIVRCLVLAALAAMLLMQPAPPPAAAEGTAGVDEDTLSAVASIEEGGGSGGSSNCQWFVLDDTGGTGSDFTDVGVTKETNGVIYRLFLRICDGVRANVWVPWGLTAADLLPGLRDEMIRRLHYPEPVFQPFDDENGWVYVQVPIDFRTTPATWDPIVLTARVDGPPGLSPWVTITAVPSELWFASGDPEDPGLVAGCIGDAALAPYVAQVPGLCSYTYRNASTTVAGDLFGAEMGIAWVVTYDSSDGPGTLTVDPTITPIPIQVAEIKALVTCTGSDPRQGGC